MTGPHLVDGSPPRWLALAGLLWWGASCAGNPSDTEPEATPELAAPAAGGSAQAGLCNVLGAVCAEGLECGRSGHCVTPGTCKTTVDCDPGRVCDAASSLCVPGSACGGEKLVADAVPPNLLLVLDRSCSMTNSAGGGLTKWQTAVTALNTLTSNQAGKIRFGLALFPDISGSSCEQGAATIPIAAGNEAAIQTVISAALVSSDPNFPDGPCTTPIDAAMHQVSLEPGLLDASRPNFAVLITDGKQANCSSYGGAAGATQIAADLHTSRGVDTFVVGFGGGIDAAELDALAAAGGRPLINSSRQYYDASDQASLDAALATIAGQTFGCVYQLAQPPANLNQIYVFFDGLEIGRNPTDGWEASGDTVTFYGAACDRLQGNTVTTLDIVFGCEAPPVK